MADRVPASILIGGEMSAALYAEFVSAIAFEGLPIIWGGEPFEIGQRVVGEPLALFDESCAWGKIDHLEAFCVRNALPFVRWSGSYPAEWSPERLVFRGTGTVDSYMIDESDRVVLDRRLLESFGSIEAAFAYFDGAEFEVPPLVVEGDPPIPETDATASAPPSQAPEPA
ncbi:MAG: hypothetical protein JHC57_14165 [Sphingopyxis sp.]|uniref:hypothetical protein n=1 Tax=Sphingopyxis sp. TaxID=1908224 RepID=UPI001A2E0458|nr:hypothetical protein [Sphingopyxis sp.]MBJ7500893.1 hypothetical protein [Sphingopyxis sp.]